MEGTISVHPKRLKPRLNREGFLAGDLERDVVPFLTSVHPAVLHAGLSSLLATLDGAGASAWPLSRLVALWLAVPRDSQYLDVLTEWDDLFRSRRLFHRLLPGDETEDVSLNDLKQLSPPLYVAPDNLGATSDVVRSATRVLRAQRQAVVQGIQRDTGFLSLASFVGQSTSDLLLNHFQSELGELIRVESVADSVVANAVMVATLFYANPKVALFRLGEESAPLVSARGELWINIDTDAGRAIVQSVCAENQGRRSLLIACHEHDPQRVALISPFLGTTSEGDDHLGLVMRSHLRGIAS